MRPVPVGWTVQGRPFREDHSGKTATSQWQQTDTIPTVLFLFYYVYRHSGSEPLLRDPQRRGVDVGPDLPC